MLILLETSLVSGIEKPELDGFENLSQRGFKSLPTQTSEQFELSGYLKRSRVDRHF